MVANLPIDVLRSFVAIVDAGSMLKAADRVFLTQSALSLQVKRLEELLQAQVFLREGRRLVLTPAGETLLGYARRLLALNDEAVGATVGTALEEPMRVGMVQDFAESLLTGVLAQFVRLHPETPLQARIAGTVELLAAMDAGALDLVLGYADPGEPTELRRDPMLWLGAPGLASRSVLPLAVLAPPCRFREAALRALDRAGVTYRIVLETPNLSTLRAGVEAGLGLTCRTPLFGGGLTPHELELLPPLPEVSTAIWRAPSQNAQAKRLESLLRDQVLYAPKAVADLAPVSRHSPDDSGRVLAAS